MKYLIILTMFFLVGCKENDTSEVATKVIEKPTREQLNLKLLRVDKFTFMEENLKVHLMYGINESLNGINESLKSISISLEKLERINK